MQVALFIARCTKILQIIACDGEVVVFAIDCYSS